jgi:Fe-S cluster biogenesis protein NfuA
MTSETLRIELDSNPGVRLARQRMRGHGGDINFDTVSDDGDVQVQFVGACNGCPALAFTFSAVVMPTVSAVPGVASVTSTQVTYSPHIAARVAAVSSPAAAAQQR